MALLNTPHPSGKLARWGLILQDVDLVIRYRLGRKNADADSLSRSPVNKEDRVDLAPKENLISNRILIATTTVVNGAKSGETSGEGCSIEDLCDCQQTGENNSSPQQKVKKNGKNLNIRKRKWMILK